MPGLEILIPLASKAFFFLFTAAMAHRLTFGERRKAKKTSSEVETSQFDVTIVTEDDESNAPFVAPRSSTAGLWRSTRNRRPPIPSSSGERKSGVSAFTLPEGYSGTGSEADMLTQDLLCWQGLQSHRPEVRWVMMTLLGAS